ncbi:transposase, partial [Glaesserella parasuis]|nr:transposase [Glaesserella parasuis]
TVICDEGEIEIETPRDRDWIAENEGAKFWANVLTELQNRGLKDIFIACVDGLKGFPEAINTVYPKTKIQLCIVHLVRNSLKFVSWKDYKAVTADLKQVYQAPTDDSVFKVIWLAIKDASKKWTMPIQNWKLAMNRFMIDFGDRLDDHR